MDDVAAGREDRLRAQDRHPDDAEPLLERLVRARLGARPQRPDEPRPKRIQTLDFLGREGTGGARTAEFENCVACPAFADRRVENPAGIRRVLVQRIPIPGGQIKEIPAGFRSAIGAGSGPNEGP